MFQTTPPLAALVRRQREPRPSVWYSKGGRAGSRENPHQGLGRISIRANTLGAVNVPDGTSGNRQRPAPQSSSASRFTAVRREPAGGEIQSAARRHAKSVATKAAAASRAARGMRPPPASPTAKAV